MHFLRLFLAFIKKLCPKSFIFPKINKRGDRNKSGGDWKIFQNLRSEGDDHSVVESTVILKYT